MTELNKFETNVMVVVCNILFIIFSYCFLAYYQGDVLLAMHHVWSGGRTVYTPEVGAAVITGILFFMNVLIAILCRFGKLLHVWSYFPSMLFLGALSDICVKGLQHGIQATGWYWAFPILSIGFLALGVYIRINVLPWLKRDLHPSIVGCTQLVMWLLFVLMVVRMSNNDSYFHYEKKAERHLVSKQYEQAAQVAIHTEEPTRMLTLLRNAALVENGQLGEKLFMFPQHYGENGLLFFPKRVRGFRYNVDSLYMRIGILPRSSDTPITYLDRINADTVVTSMATSYHFASALLRKDIKKLMHMLDNPNIPDADKWTRHNKEAAILYNYIHAATDTLVRDTLLQYKFQDYLNIQASESNHVRQKHVLKERYGDTFWWYYQYQ